MSKVTIRGVDKHIWEAARIQSIKENKTMGEIVNESLRLRQDKKAKADKI